MKIKKKDKVVVLTGKDKGKVGEIVAVFPKENRVKVSGVNMVARHTKPSQANPQGGIVRREALIHASNVALVDPKTNKATRAGVKFVKGVKTRIARRSGEEV
ncbi:MAG: 50S ribosomal protein L24 [Bdellovibrionales bacterium]